jgi:hypothetical protein
MALAPRTVQNIPDRLRRLPITALYPASMTPEPINGFGGGTGDIACERHFVRSSRPRPGSRQPTVDRRFPSSQRVYGFVDLASIEFALLAYHPALLLGVSLGIQSTRQFPDMLSGMIEIHDLNRAGKVRPGMFQVYSAPSPMIVSLWHDSSHAPRLRYTGDGQTHQLVQSAPYRWWGLHRTLAGSCSSVVV